MKRCCRCKVEQPFENFTKRKKSKDGLQGYCRSCSNIAAVATGKRHREAYSKKVRWTKYGITEDLFLDMWDKQAGICAICSADLALSNHIDHDHKTGEVRGILCSHCNLGLGHFRDNPAFLSEAITYLQTRGQHG